LCGAAAAPARSPGPHRWKSAWARRRGPSIGAVIRCRPGAVFTSRRPAQRPAARLRTAETVMGKANGSVAGEFRQGPAPAPPGSPACGTGSQGYSSAPGLRWKAWLKTISPVGPPPRLHAASP
jgi:hypothetical protein